MSFKDHGRIVQLDGLRAIAILSVFVHHALRVPLLWIGVDLFFVLSGFLITGILLHRKSQDRSYLSYFYERRARRILVPYVGLLLVLSCLFGIKWMQHWYWYAFFATNLAGALQQVGHESLQPLWSLGVEEQFYLVWPIVVLAVPEKLLARIAVGIMLTAPLVRALATPLFSTHFPIYFLTPFRMDLLCAGALVAILWRKRPLLFQRFRLQAHACVITTVLLLFCVSRYPQYRTGSNTVLANAFLYSIVLLLVTSVLFIALSGRGVFCDILRWPALGYIGVVSYSMYLIHMSAIILSQQLFTNRVVSFFVSLIATVLYATFTWYGFEKRLLKSKQATGKASLLPTHA